MYKLLGLPQSLEEVIDKSKKSKYIPNIIVKRTLGNSLVPGEVPCKYSVGIKMGNFNLRLWESGEVWLKHPQYLKKSILRDCFALGKAYEFADKLSSEGLVVKINGTFHNLKISKL